VLSDLSIYLVELLLVQAGSAFGPSSPSESKASNESQLANYNALVMRFVGFTEVDASKHASDSHPLRLLLGLIAEREEEAAYRDYLQGRIDAILDKFGSVLASQDISSSSHDVPVFEALKPSDIDHRRAQRKEASNATKVLFDVDSIFSLKSVFEGEELLSLDPTNVCLPRFFSFLLFA
jgi:hypothetical protein